jgi:long-chain acyl-CoA synthetase
LIGGSAPLEVATQQWWMDVARMPIHQGYGLTETSPILTLNKLENFKDHADGLPMGNAEIKIDSPDENGVGEIFAKGSSVMLGYYKNENATKETFKDGWFKTGDLGILDETNYLYIRGRSKNVIIGPGGENIFPEDIESVINNFKHVAESLVIQQKGKLVAMVHFNREEIEEKYHAMKEDVEKKYEELKKELQEYVNARVSKFSKIQEVILQKEEFVKTATKKIKRFLYTKTHPQQEI